MLQYFYNQTIQDWNTKHARLLIPVEGNFWHAQRIKHDKNEKCTAENKQTTLKNPLGSTCSVTNHQNEMKFQPWVF